MLDEKIASEQIQSADRVTIKEQLISEQNALFSKKKIIIVDTEKNDNSLIDEDALDDEERNKVYYFECVIKLINNIIIDFTYEDLREDLNNKNSVQMMKIIKNKFCSDTEQSVNVVYKQLSNLRADRKDSLFLIIQHYFLKVEKLKIRRRNIDEKIILSERLSQAVRTALMRSSDE